MGLAMKLSDWRTTLPMSVVFSVYASILSRQAVGGAGK